MDYLTPSQAATILGISDSSVRRLIIDGHINAVKPTPRVTLILRSDLEAAKNRPRVGNPNFIKKPSKRRGKK